MEYGAISQIGERIKNQRESLGMTQSELGEKIGVTGVAIMRYEKGLRSPKIDIIQRIAEALEITPDYLVGFTREPHTRMANQADIDKMYGDPLFPMELAESEKEMLDKYRMLTVEGRNAVDELVNYFLGLELKTKK